MQRIKKTFCPKCEQPVEVDSHYNFTSHNHPIYYCKPCNKYFAFFGNVLIQSSEKIGE